jgi:hypothetical protein
MKIFKLKYELHHGFVDKGWSKAKRGWGVANFLVASLPLGPGFEFVTGTKSNYAEQQRGGS